MVSVPRIISKKCSLWKRKRTERSKKPFLLMLMVVGELSEGLEGKSVAKNIESVILFSTRETDIKGWYQQNSVLGVICTEISESDVKSAKDQIQAKILKGLSSFLSPENVNRIRISFHVFPGDCGKAHGFEEPDLTFYPELARNNSSKAFARSVKRVMDILGSLGIIIVASPVFLGIALAIKLTSKGPILFRQERVGQYGKRFTFLKFRSMFTKCDEKVHKDYVQKFIKNQACYKTSGDNGDGRDAVYKVVDDPRITSIGRFIRKTSLDELPQCFNVLKGDMSLVGPRPPIAYELECYDVWHRRRILEMKPGITGLWQVKGRSSTNFDEMVRLDLQYTREWSLWLDIKILLLTPYVALAGKGGY